MAKGLGAAGAPVPAESTPDTAPRGSSTRIATATARRGMALPRLRQDVLLQDDGAARLLEGPVRDVDRLRRAHSLADGYATFLDRQRSRKLSLVDLRHEQTRQHQLPHGIIAGSWHLLMGAGVPDAHHGPLEEMHIALLCIPTRLGVEIA